MTQKIGPHILVCHERIYMMDLQQWLCGVGYVKCSNQRPYLPPIRKGFALREWHRVPVQKANCQKLLCAKGRKF